MVIVLRLVPISRPSALSLLVILLVHFSIHSEFYTSANSTLVKEVPEAIRLAQTTDRVKAPTPEVAEHAFNIAYQLNEQHIKYTALIQEPHVLSTLLESERFTLKSIKAFARKKKVIDSAIRIKKLLTDMESKPDTT